MGKGHLQLADQPINYHSTVSENWGNAQIIQNQTVLVLKPMVTSGSPFEETQDKKNIYVYKSHWSEYKSHWSECLYTIYISNYTFSTAFCTNKTHYFLYNGISIFVPSRLILTPQLHRFPRSQWGQIQVRPSFPLSVCEDGHLAHRKLDEPNFFKHGDLKNSHFLNMVIWKIAMWKFTGYVCFVKPSSLVIFP